MVISLLVQGKRIREFHVHSFLESLDFHSGTVLHPLNGLFGNRNAVVANPPAQLHVLGKLQYILFPWEHSRSI